MNLVHASMLGFDQCISCAMDIALSQPDWHGRSLKSFESWVVNPAIHEQMAFGLQGVEPVAFCTWAMLDEDGIAHYLAGEWLEMDQWDSGVALWCVDMVAKPGSGAEFARRMRKSKHITGMPVFWYRTKREKIGSMPVRRH